jgi:hypothetical protein
MFGHQLRRSSETQEFSFITVEGDDRPDLGFAPRQRPRLVEYDYFNLFGTLECF